MKLKKLLILCMALLMGIVFSSSFFIQNVKADDVKLVKKLSPNADYPDIKTQFDITNMHQYSDSELADPVKSNVTLKSFYVKYVSYDPDKSTNLLLTSSKKSNQLFFTHIDSKVKVKSNNKVTIQGSLIGNDKVKSGSNGYGHMKKQYINKPDTLINTSKISVHHK